MSNRFQQFFEKNRLAELLRGQTILAKTIFVLAVVITLYHVYYNMGFHTMLDMRIAAPSHEGLSLGLIVILAYLIHPLKKIPKDKGAKLGWYDLVLMVMGAGPALYFFLFYDQIQRQSALGVATDFDVIAVFAMMISLLEMGRRTSGIGLPIVAILFFAHPFIGSYFPWIFNTPEFAVNRIVSLFFTTLSGIWGTPMRVASTTIIMFLIFAEVMLYSGAGRFFVNLAMSIFGGVRGGPAKVAIVASAFFGSLTGSAVANVAAVGSITIPLMKRVGYNPTFAGAVECVSSNGGHVMPPVMGTAAFVMAEFLDIPYGQIIIFAIIPAILYFWSVYVQVDIEAVRFKLSGLPRSELPSFGRTMREGWFYLLPIAVLICLLTILKFSTVKSAIYSSLLVIFVSQFDRFKEGRINLASIINALSHVARMTIIVMIPCALAGVIIGSVAITGLGVTFSYGLVSISGGNMFFLILLTLFASFILGLGLTTTPIYITLAVLVAPALVQMEVPLMAAHLGILYWGFLADVTPPTCISAFAAATIADAKPMSVGWRATRLAVGAYMAPVLMFYNPALVLFGPIWLIGAKFILIALGLGAVGVAVTGAFLAELNWMKRIIIAASGIMIVTPSWNFIFAGLAILAVMFLWEIRKERLNAPLLLWVGRTKKVTDGRKVD